ncbi:MAG: nuclear transport factor 2 family protein [Myxococcota bacterium]
MSVEANKAVVRRYFKAIEEADYATIETLLADQVRFWLPPSVPDGVEFAGRSDVMRNIVESIAGLYDTRVGLHPEIQHLTAEDDRVAAELVIRGRSKASGRDYRNHYHFLFVIRDGRIAEFHEHLDTLYAFRALFEPAGITEREQVTWLPGEGGGS